MLRPANKLPKTPGVLVVKPGESRRISQLPSSEVMASCPWRVNSRIPRGTKKPRRKRRGTRAFEIYWSFPHFIWLVVTGTWLLFLHILGIIAPTDSYFSEGVKPPITLFTGEIKKYKSYDMSGINSRY